MVRTMRFAGGLGGHRPERLFGALDAIANVGVPIQMGYGRFLRVLVKAQRVRRTVEILERKAARGKQREEGWPLFRKRGGETSILFDSSFKISLSLHSAPQLEPDSGRQGFGAGISEILIILPGSFKVLRFQMKLNELGHCVAISRNIVLAPMDLLLKRVAFNRFGIGSEKGLQRCNSVVQLSLFQLLGGLNDGRRGGPSD